MTGLEDAMDDKEFDAEVARLHKELKDGSDAFKAKTASIHKDLDRDFREVEAGLGLRGLWLRLLRKLGR